MDERFKQMLMEAEKIRAECKQTGSIGQHGRHMAKMIRYGQENKLLTGDLLAGTASEENLCLAAEGGACILEVIHDEAVGSILNLPREKKMAITRRAKEKAEQDVKRFGPL